MPIRWIPMDDHTPSIPCFDRGTHVHRCKLIQWKHLCAVDGNHAQLPCGILWQPAGFLDRYIGGGCNWRLQPAAATHVRLSQNA